jgi:hypothetical protein
MCQGRLPAAGKARHAAATGEAAKHAPADEEAAGVADTAVETAVDEPTARAEGRACVSCTLINPWSATSCSLCHARLPTVGVPNARERERALQEEAERQAAIDEAARREEAWRTAPRPTMEAEGYAYREVEAFGEGWATLVETAATAAEELLLADARAERSERRLETINSNRRQLRFLPDGPSHTRSLRTRVRTAVPLPPPPAFVRGPCQPF